MLGIRINTPSISFTVNINCPISGAEIEQKLQVRPLEIINNLFWLTSNFLGYPRWISELVTSLYTFTDAALIEEVQNECSLFYFIIY